MQHIEKEYSHVFESSRHQQTALFTLYEGLIMLGTSGNISWHSRLFSLTGSLPAKLDYIGLDSIRACSGVRNLLG